MESNIEYQHCHNSAAGSSRSVANLPIDKLYRKRAIDRENQRLLRHKNKARLQELEAENKKLRQELQHSAQEKMKFQAQSQDHRHKIDSVISTLQALQGSCMGSPPYFETSASTFAMNLKPGTGSLPSPADEPHDTTVPPARSSELLFENHTLDNDFWNHGGSLTFSLDGSRFPEVQDFSLDLETLTAGTLTTPYDNFDLLTLPPPNTGSDEAQSYNSAAFEEARANANNIRNTLHIWAILPNNSPPTCPMDELIVSVIEERRKQASQASPDVGAGEFAHANFPSVSTLLNPVLYEEDKPVASTIARHVASVIRVYTTPEKTALLYIICLLIRWLICPTEENYDSIPEFMRPTGHQLMIPHPFWIETIGWPRARDRLIRHMDYTEWPTFRHVINRTFSINWPHQMVGILDGTPEKGFVLTKAFVEHIRDSSNWTVGQEVIAAFPFLDGTMNLK